MDYILISLFPCCTDGDLRDKQSFFELAANITVDPLGLGEKTEPANIAFSSEHAHNQAEVPQ